MWPASRLASSVAVNPRAGLWLARAAWYHRFSSGSQRPSLGPHAFRRGEVAQLVEHTTENRSVDSSILSLATIS